MRAGEWYMDAALSGPGEAQPIGTYFKVLQVGVHTLQVQEVSGEVRTVNRMIFESQCVPSSKAPVVDAGHV